jgi:hypothetical protein
MHRWWRSTGGGSGVARTEEAAWHSSGVGETEKMRVDEFSNFYEAERFSILEEHSQIPPLTTASIKHR